MLFDDEDKLKEFIEDDVPCSSVIYLAYYVKCKKENVDVPPKIDLFVTNCIEEIVKNYHEGKKPNYDKLFKLQYSRGRNRKSALS